MKRSEKTKSKSGIPRGKDAAESAVGEQEIRERIAQKAYALYEKRGQTHGNDLGDWFEAERLVLAQLEEQHHSKPRTPPQKSNGTKRTKRPNED